MVYKGVVGETGVSLKFPSTQKNKTTQNKQPKKKNKKKTLMYFCPHPGNIIGPVVTSLITGGLESLLRMPMGCGEQTMIFLAPNVYVMQYLLRTRQVTADIESKAYRMIQSGE